MRTRFRRVAAEIDPVFTDSEDLDAFREAQRAAHAAAGADEKGIIVGRMVGWPDGPGVTLDGAFFPEKWALRITAVLRTCREEIEAEEARGG